MKPDFSLAYVPVDKHMRVDAAVGCGKRFEGVAWILEYASQNPSLKIEKGLGLGAVKKIVARIEDGFVE
ncbi:MAG TPA: hypothetical protein V6D19_15095 [Stenomitos sp.]